MNKETELEINSVYHDLDGSYYYNHDIAPITSHNRKWNTRDYIMLWISLSACITTYMLASSLIAEGMNWLEAIITIFVANVIVLIPVLLNARVGAKYGIPFPVYSRISFGLIGANIPALLRALVGCGWFGIQSWIGGQAIYHILLVFCPQWANFPANILDINIIQLICFLFFCSINAFIIYKGIECIRILLNIKAPLLIILGLALLAWAYWRAHGFGPMLSQPSAFRADGAKAGQFWIFFFPALTGMIGYWSTLSLNIPDFTRYAKSQRAHSIGQSIGLPFTMLLYAFIGVAVTSASIIIFGKAIWDPVALMGKFQNPVILIIAMSTVIIATLATNIAANLVSPANDFSNIWPQKISFKAGGYIAIVIGILMQPWKLIADPSGYIFKWLVAYSSLLGTIGGILIADYYCIRKQVIDIRALYHKHPKYWYFKGFNPIAIIALSCGISPCVPGFLATIDLIHVTKIWLNLYNYAWFIGFIIAFIVYFGLTKIFRSNGEQL